MKMPSFVQIGPAVADIWVLSFLGGFSATTGDLDQNWYEAFLEAGAEQGQVADCPAAEEPKARFNQMHQQPDLALPLPPFSTLLLQMYDTDYNVCHLHLWHFFLVNGPFLTFNFFP